MGPERLVAASIRADFGVLFVDAIPLLPSTRPVSLLERYANMATHSLGSSCCPFLSVDQLLVWALSSAERLE
jgi:hypothetical protein